jgi:hypothetical protein
MVQRIRSGFKASCSRGSDSFQGAAKFENWPPTQPPSAPHRHCEEGVSPTPGPMFFSGWQSLGQDGLLPHSHCEQAVWPTPGPCLFSGWQSLGQDGVLPYSHCEEPVSPTPGPMFFSGWQFRGQDGLLPHSHCEQAVRPTPGPCLFSGWQSLGQDGLLPHSHCEEAGRPTPGPMFFSGWQSLGEQAFFDGKIATLKTTSGQAPLRARNDSSADALRPSPSLRGAVWVKVIHGGGVRGGGQRAPAKGKGMTPSAGLRARGVLGGEENVEPHGLEAPS